MWDPRTPIFSTVFFACGNVNAKEPTEQKVDTTFESKLAAGQFAIATGLRYDVYECVAKHTRFPAKNGNSNRGNWNRQQVAAGQNRGRHRGHRHQSQFLDVSRTSGEFRGCGVLRRGQVLLRRGDY